VSTDRGLAKTCGIAPSTLFDWGEDAPVEGDRLRMGKMAELLSAQGFTGDRLFVKISFENQPKINAYPDSVCMAFLEYYAFEAERHCNETAKTNYRYLARKSLRDFIYQKTGYDPQNQIRDSWKHYHDRLLLNPTPVGYFSVFKETADIVLASIEHGLPVDEHTVPDISVGKIWSDFWSKNNLSEAYGNRISYSHKYPDYYPQAKANEDIKPYAYPYKALGDFREWLQNDYLPIKYPAYLSRKVKQGVFPASKKEAMLKAFTPQKFKEIT